ncbi:MAG: hypothetical protein ACOX66_00895 [Oscillospiraceae bacterium]|jgi:hypothetical protein
MELFDKTGHLTNEALTALDSDALDELSRLEISEHLSFCDRCLDRYLAALTADKLETPAHSCREGLLQRIRRQTLRLLENRVATAVAAVVIVVSLWNGGAFGALLSLPGRLTQFPVTVSESIETQRSKNASFFEGLGNWFEDLGKDQTNIGGNKK